MQMNPLCEEFTGQCITYPINATTDSNGNYNVGVVTGKICGMVFNPSSGSYGEIVVPWIYPTGGSGAIHLHAQDWDGVRAAGVSLIGNLYVYTKPF